MLGRWRSGNPAPAAVPVPPSRPELIRRREANRQKTLAEQKQAAAPPPADQVHTRTQYCWIGGFTSWTAARVPISVVCLKEYYADGHHQAWALMTTHASAGPLALLGYY